MKVQINDERKAGGNLSIRLDGEEWTDKILDDWHIEQTYDDHWTLHVSIPCKSPEIRICA